MVCRAMSDVSDHWRKIIFLTFWRGLIFFPVMLPTFNLYTLYRIHKRKHLIELLVFIIQSSNTQFLFGTFVLGHVHIFPWTYCAHHYLGTTWQVIKTQERILSKKFLKRSKLEIKQSLNLLRYVVRYFFIGIKKL